MGDVDVDPVGVAVGLAVAWLLLVAAQEWAEDALEDATSGFLEETIEGATGGLIDV